jgi:hypothetical protein
LKSSVRDVYIWSTLGSQTRRTILTIGQLILFLTEAGDGWLLDPIDWLAARVAREGEPEPVHFEETDATLSIH